MQIRTSIAALAAIALTGFALNAEAALTPIVVYDAADGIGVDSSGMGNDGTAGAGVTVVAGGPNAGDMSYEFDGSTDRIITNDIDLLDNASIVAAGGFTMDVWFNTSSTTLGGSASLIDYAGTEGIQFNPNFGIDFKLSDSAGALLTSSAGPLNDGQWHHVVATFTVTNGADLTNVIGDITLDVDGTVDTATGVFVSDFGDSLNRPIGFGGHPSGFAGDIYIGQLNDPTVSLGVPEPGSLALLGLGGLALLRRRRA
ncbi:PEP-CTERM sorting domain-containing protein [Phycisphaeraceae bacterium D3-23]